MERGMGKTGGKIGVGGVRNRIRKEGNKGKVLMKRKKSNEEVRYRKPSQNVFSYFSIRRKDVSREARDIYCCG